MAFDVKEYKAQWRRRNSEKIKESNQKYYETHKQEISERMSAYEKLPQRKESKRNHNYRTRYGISLEEFNKL